MPKKQNVFSRIFRSSLYIGGAFCAIMQNISPVYAALDNDNISGSAAPRTPVTSESISKISKKTPLSNADIQNNEQINKVSSIGFSWNMPVGVSVFNRNEYVWLVFDHNQTIDIDNIREQTKDVASEVVQIPHNKATILRFRLNEDVKTGLRKEGLLWILDLYTHDIEYKIKDMPVFTQYDSGKHSYLYIPTTNSGPIISVVDPEIGDTILTAPNMELGVGIKNEYQYPDLEVLSSAQGIAIVPNTSDITLNRGNTGISIKANNRGLNISDNLDSAKRQSRLKAKNDLQNIDLWVPKQLQSLPFNSAEEQLLQDIEKSPTEKKDIARMELVKYYISKGLGTNALKVLEEIKNSQSPVIQTEKFAALSGAANFLTQRYKQATENFSFGRLPEYDEAIFWRTLSSTAQEFKKEDVIVLFSLMSVMKDYSQELRERIALVGAEAAIKAGNDMATQNFMDVLKSSKNNINRKAHILYLNAQKFEIQGHLRNAVHEYKNIINMDSQKYPALARFAKINLELKLNVTTPEKAIREFERLRYAWGETSFKLRLLEKLAETYAAQKDFYHALQTYNEARNLANTELKKQINNKMVSLFENIYLQNLADSMSPLKNLALYRDFEWLAPQSDHYNEIILKLADRLVAVDLLGRASDILKDQLDRPDISQQQRAKTGARLALVHLFEGNNRDALDILDDTEYPNLPETVTAHRRIIKAKALSSLGYNDEALEWLKDDVSKNALLLKSEIYWKQEDWGLAADNLKYLIEKPEKDKPLSEEQIAYILDWATALKKAGRETVIIRLRNKFLPYFQNTPYASIFNVLTNTLEKDKIDIKSINEAISDISAYSNFSKLYNQALRKDETAQDAEE